LEGSSIAELEARGYRLPGCARWRWRSALTALHLYQARERGCTTASVQATEMAEGIYAAIRFRDLGRFVEYVQ
jgi:hypothetical protein